MTDLPYHIRGYLPTDFDNLVRLYRESESREPLGRPATPEALEDKLRLPGYNPALDLKIVAVGSELVGFMDIVPELGIGRVIADSWLAPEHRRRGLGTRLLRCAMDRSRELGAHLVHVSIREDNLSAAVILSHLGFTYIRKFLELKLDMSAVDWKEAERAAGEYCTFQPGQEEELTRVQNRSFAEHWGYNPNTVAMARYRLSLSHRSPEDIILACEDNRVAGFCWTEIIEQENGRIYMIGTDPDYRGREIGRGLLLAGLFRLKTQTVSCVWLTVDSTNEVACSLYESMGFKRDRAYLWYEKAVD